MAISTKKYNKPDKKGKKRKVFGSKVVTRSFADSKRDLEANKPEGDLTASDRAEMTQDQEILFKCQMQWQLGDWQKLALIELASIQNCSQRSLVALMAGCANLQIGDEVNARRYLSTASRWGCSPEIMLKALTAITETNLAHFYGVQGDHEKEQKYLLSSVAPFGGDALLACKARTAMALEESNHRKLSHISSQQANERDGGEGVTKSKLPQALQYTKYDLSHLEQYEDQYVIGPIQDDEALFLYSIIRGMRIERILELGGHEGYSAKNFLKAMGPSGILYTCDIHEVPSQGENHRILIKDCKELNSLDFEGEALEMIFFDCHEYEAQMTCFERLRTQGLVEDHTIIALHDTNLHPEKHVDWAYPVEGGYIHQAVERRMVNDFLEQGYHPFMLHTLNKKHNESFPFRHGITVMQKINKLKI